MVHRALASYAAGQGQDEAELLLKHATIVDRQARRLVARTGMQSAYDDLWSAGALGLLEASRKFDTSRGVAFEGFATERVRGAMLDELRRMDHLPRRLRTQMTDAATRKRHLATHLGHEPSGDELAADLGVSIEALGELESLGEPHVSLEWAAGLAGAEGTAEDAIARAQAKSALAEAIESLPERLRMLLGLLYMEELSYAEVGQLLEISKPRVCQLHAEAIEKLRAVMGRAPTAGL